jgi:hypothetical protein
MLRMRSYLTRLQLNLGVRRHPTNLVMKALFYGCAAVLLAASPFRAAHTQSAKVPPSLALVRALYAQYACEAVLDYCDGDHELLDQPRRVLERYFDSTLAALWSLIERVRPERMRYVGLISCRCGTRRIRLEPWSLFCRARTQRRFELSFGTSERLSRVSSFIL